MNTVQGTSAALNNDDRRQLLDIIGRLNSSAATVDATQLACARNLAARAGFTRTQVALDQEIQRRGEGAQDPDALRAAERLTGTAALPASLGSNTTESKENKPLWPFILGAIVVIGGMSYMSHKGHHEIAARVERQRKERGF